MELQSIIDGGVGANCYLIKTKNTAIVIDPFSVGQRVIDFFDQNSECEKYIFLTHCHYDHILGADELRKIYGAKIGIGKNDEAGLTDTSISLSKKAGMEQKPFFADITFNDGDLFQTADIEIKIMETPGHTAGSVCYIVEDYIFSGDTLFQGTVGRTDLPTGDFDVLMSSLEKIKNLKQNYKIFPGHGMATTLDREKALNPYLR